MTRFHATLCALLFFGCAKPNATTPTMQWRFEAREAANDIRVLPTIALHPISTEVSTETWLGMALSGPRLDVRKQRVASLQAIPSSLGWALPGAIHEALDGQHQGDFHVGRWPSGTRDRVARRLSAAQDIDDLLASIAKEGKGKGTLFTWVYSVQGSPMTTMGPAGEMVDGPNGPLVLSLEEEAYRVDVRMGAALVANDGEIVFRLTEQSAAILGNQGVEQTSWDLARSVSNELSKVWLSPSQ